MSVMFSRPENAVDQYAVKYGTSPSSLPNIVTATKTHLDLGSYTRDIYEAILTDLSATSTYYYRIYCTTDPSEYEGTTFFFDTFSDDNRGDTTSPTEFIAVADGDGGTFEDINLYLNLTGIIKSSKFMLFPGDFSFSDSEDENWDEAEAYIMPYAAYSPVMYTPGNHDHDDNDEWFGWETRLTTHLGTNSFSNSNFWYAFKYRYFHVIQLSTEHDFDEGSEQYEWLEEELEERVDRSQTPFLLVQFHRTIYTSSDGHSSYESFREEIEPLLVTHKVTAVFAGHVHGYERTCEVAYEQVVHSHPTNDYSNLTDGIVHLLVGSGGRSFYDWEVPQPEWSQIRLSEHGFLKCNAKVIPDPQMVCQFIKVEDLETTAVAMDTFTLGYTSCGRKYPYDEGYNQSACGNNEQEGTGSDDDDDDSGGGVSAGAVVGAVLGSFFGILGVLLGLGCCFLILVIGCCLFLVGLSLGILCGGTGGSGFTYYYHHVNQDDEGGEIKKNNVDVVDDLELKEEEPSPTIPNSGRGGVISRGRGRVNNVRGRRPLPRRDNRPPPPPRRN